MYFDIKCGIIKSLLYIEASPMKTIHVISDERLITPSGIVFAGQILG